MRRLRSAPAPWTLGISVSHDAKRDEILLQQASGGAAKQPQVSLKSASKDADTKRPIGLSPTWAASAAISDSVNQLVRPMLVAFVRDKEEPVREQVVVENPDEKSSRSPSPAHSITSLIISQQVPALTIPALSPATLQHQEELISLVHEKSSTLAFLGGMFGLGEWGGRESVSGDEMETMEVEGKGKAAYEVVPRVMDKVASNTEVEGTEKEEIEEITMDDPNEKQDDEQDEAHSPIKHPSLKAMFRSQEESTGFSLGLNIELDPDAESFLPASISVLPPEPVRAPASIITEKRAHTIQFTLDSNVPLFFPGGKNDLFRVIGEKRWEWSHPDTSEEIRAKWDRNKAELTEEYTRRHREAMEKRKWGGTKGDET